MLKKIRNLLESKSSEEAIFKTRPHAYGLEFLSENMEPLRAGQGTAVEKHQFVTLRMLVEQGIAKEISAGFDIFSEDVVCLGEAERLLLGMPAPWNGEFCITFNNVTTHPAFSLNFELILPSGERISQFKMDGPFLYLSKQEIFLPDRAQWDLIETVRKHANLTSEKRTESTNLQTVYELQKAQADGAIVDLSQFENLRIAKPQSVGVSISQNDDGSLELIPKVKNAATPGEVQKSIPNLKSGDSVIRGNDAITVLNKDCLQAVEEILSNSTIPAYQVRQFFKTPSAFIDAAKVDLDMKFSIRVKGATVFEPAYFGEKDASLTDWTGTSGLSNPPALPLSDAGHVLKSSEEIEDLRKDVRQAREQKKTEITYGGRNYILDPDPRTDEPTFIDIKKAVEKKTDGDSSDSKNTDQKDDKKIEVSATVDIVPQDTLNEMETKLTPDRTYAYDLPLQIPDCKRTAFSYQETGIRWLLGLATNNGCMNWETPFVGGVLADDMGLGKTFMALAAAVKYSHLLKEKGKTVKPCLVVAPLSLLENWREEVYKVFEPSPFVDIVTLQGQADLSKFRARAGNETKQREEDIETGLNAIRYALKVGTSWGTERLDMPRRLVLTTYQTLRDYQFSLCLIDWGFAIFDEAQNIKNPNALQTRAAKGIKADFVLPTTGTPVENSLADFWCLFDTASPGLLKNYQSFRKEYIIPITKATGEEQDAIRAKVGKKLRNAVGNLMLRRVKEEELEGLPKKYIHNGADKNASHALSPEMQIEMEGEQRKWYESILGSVAAAVDSGDTEGNSGMLKALHSLRDVSLHPALLNGGLPTPASSSAETRKQFEVSGKLKILLSTLDQIRNRDEKVIVFAIRKRLQTYLAISLSTIYGLNVDIINGDTKAISKRNSCETRLGIIKRFEGQDGFNVIIMSPVAAGVGLTVVGANNVVHLERHWNPAKETQATDRVYRIGATKDVHVYIPILTHPEIDSFDVNLNRLLNRKLDLKDAVVTPVEVSGSDLVSAGTFGGGTTFKENAIVTAQDMVNMSWQNFEALVALAFENKFGGESMLTKYPNDWGADAVIKTPAGNVLVQSKHTSKDGSLKGDGAIREVYGATPKYKELLGEDIARLIVATNAKYISSEIRKTAKGYGVELWGYRELAPILEKAKISYSKIIAKENSNRFPN